MDQSGSRILGPSDVTGFFFRYDVMRFRIFYPWKGRGRWTDPRDPTKIAFQIIRIFGLEREGGSATRVTTRPGGWILLGQWHGQKTRVLGDYLRGESSATSATQ